MGQQPIPQHTGEVPPVGRHDHDPSMRRIRNMAYLAQHSIPQGQGDLGPGSVRAAVLGDFKGNAS